MIATRLFSLVASRLMQVMLFIVLTPCFIKADIHVNGSFLGLSPSGMFYCYSVPGEIPEGAVLLRVASINANSNGLDVIMERWSAEPKVSWLTDDVFFVADLMSIALWRLSNKTVEIVYTPDDGQFIAALSVSPDGRYLIVTTREYHTREVAIFLLELHSQAKATSTILLKMCLAEEEDEDFLRETQIAWSADSLACIIRDPVDDVHIVHLRRFSDHIEHTTRRKVACAVGNGDVLLVGKKGYYFHYGKLSSIDMDTIDTMRLPPWEVGVAGMVAAHEGILYWSTKSAPCGLSEGARQLVTTSLFKYDIATARLTVESLCGSLIGWSQKILVYDDGSPDKPGFRIVSSRPLPAAGTTPHETCP